MVERPRVLDHMGAHIEHAPVKGFSEISEKAHTAFHTAMGGYDRDESSHRDFLISRFMYISEIMSTAIRLNASWALTHAAMSLTRDRYEQTVRFSWLARQSDDGEMAKFYAYYHARANKIFSRLKGQAKEEFDKMVDEAPEWTTRPFTKEEKEYFGAWEVLDLLSLVKKRDKLPALGTSIMAGQKLELWYTPVYQQFSSVSHSDMYSVALLQLHKSKAFSDRLVLAADPYWPMTLTCFNALFDIIQCFECAKGFYAKDCEEEFQELFTTWNSYTDKVFGTAAANPRPSG
jgi:hypothetical protein